MQQAPGPPHPRASDRGFTLLEVMIAVVVVAILAMIALPAYQDSIRKSRRSEAVTALMAVQQAQERWRANHSRYANHGEITASTTATPPGLGLPETTSSGYYGITISEPDATGYIATASALSGTSQARDGDCKVLAVRMAGGSLSYGSGSDSADWADPGRCWAR